MCGLNDHGWKRVDLKLVGRLEFGSGAVAMRYYLLGSKPYLL
jgi:hypothetical protein